MNVNTFGSDVGFSESKSHGPARQFLQESEGCSWDKTQILIIKAKSEKQALFFEYKKLIFLIYLKVNINMKMKNTKGEEKMNLFKKIKFKTIL